MMKAAGEIRVDLVNQIIVEVDIPTEWEFSTVVSCCKGK